MDEDTIQGKEELENLPNLSIEIRHLAMNGNNKTKAFMEFDTKKGFFLNHLSFDGTYVMAWGKANIEILEKLLQLANRLEANLYANFKIFTAENLEETKQTLKPFKRSSNIMAKQPLAE